MAASTPQRLQVALTEKTQALTEKTQQATQLEGWITSLAFAVEEKQARIVQLEAELDLSRQETVDARSQLRDALFAFAAAARGAQGAPLRRAVAAPAVEHTAAAERPRRDRKRDRKAAVVLS